MTSPGMDLIYERYKASPNYVSKELLDYLCNEKEFCNHCQICGPKKTYFYTNSSLKFHYRLRHAQEILKYFPNSNMVGNDGAVKNEEQFEDEGSDFDWKDNDEDDNDSVTLSLSGSEEDDDIVVTRVVLKDRTSKNCTTIQDESTETITISSEDEDDNRVWFDDNFRLYLSESDDEELEPTMEITQQTSLTEKEKSEQNSFSINGAVSNFCFESEQYPSLKIIKIESIDYKLWETIDESEVIENDIKVEKIEEEEYLESIGEDEDLDIDDKGQLHTTLQNTIFERKEDF